MREYARLWSVYLSTVIPLQAFMFTYFFYFVLVVRSNWVFTWFSSVLSSYMFVAMFALTRACALVDKKNRAVAKQNRVLYVQFVKSFPMTAQYLLKVR